MVPALCPGLHAMAGERRLAGDDPWPESVGGDSLDVLGAPRALDGLGPPALFLLRDVVLQNKPVAVRGQPAASGMARTGGRAGRVWELP